jgi:ABC-2 type transport system permease protein
MLRLFFFEVFKLFRLRSVGLGLLSAFLLPFLWALAPGLKEVYGLVLASGWQVVALSLLAGMEFLFPFLVVMAASESLGSEVAQGTLKSLLLRPLSRTQLLLAKLLAVLLYPFVLLGASFLGGVVAGLPHGLGPFFGGTGLGEGGFAGAGLLTPKEALWELLRAHLLAGAVLMPLASLALLYGTLFLSTTASALAAVATLLLMRLLVAFPAFTPFLLTTYLDLHLRPEAAGLGLSLLLIYTLGFAFLGALVFERRDL